MGVDKTYQIYSEAKKQLFEERFQLAQEYLSKKYDGISIVIYKGSDEIRFATIERCEVFGTAFLLPAGRVNPYLPYNFFISELKFVANEAKARMKQNLALLNETHLTQK